MSCTGATGQHQEVIFMANKTKTLKLVELGVLLALMLIMAFTPLGYLKVGVLEITFMTVPVIIGAIVLGPAAGALLGGFFGLTSFLQCFGMSAFGTVLLGINPLLTFLVCFLPRLLMGWITGLIFRGLIRVDKTRTISYGVTGLCGALLNTLLFMTALMVCFGATEYIQTMQAGMPLLSFLVAFVGINGLVEAIVCFILSAAVAKAVDKFVNKRAFAE